MVVFRNKFLYFVDNSKKLLMWRVETIEQKSDPETMGADIEEFAIDELGTVFALSHTGSVSKLTASDQPEKTVLQQGRYFSCIAAKDGKIVVSSIVDNKHYFHLLDGSLKVIGDSVSEAPDEGRVY